MTFLNNWFRTDRSGTSLLYASAVAVEEKSLIDYNQGNPDGVLDPGETPRKPKVPLVAVYPKEGTLYSDSPLYVLDADWVSAQEKEGAEAFIESVQRPASQEKVLEYGFRPGNPDVAVGAPITKGNGVDPSQPSQLLQVPQPSVMIDMLENWKQQRKGARVLLVLDVSGSMEEPADPDDPASDTKLDLAKRAAIDALDEFKGDDEVGLRVFSTNLGPGEDANYLDLLDVQPMSTNRERLASQIRDQLPQNATPLYEVTQDSFEDMAGDYDPKLINAVVLLTDGVNDDGDTSRRPQPARRAPHHAAGGDRRRERHPHPGVHDRLRQAGRLRHPRAHRRVHQRRRLRRQQPGHDLQGLHRRGVQLLTPATPRVPGGCTATG